MGLNAVEYVWQWSLLLPIPVNLNGCVRDVACCHLYLKLYIHDKLNKHVHFYAVVVKALVGSYCLSFFVGRRLFLDTAIECKVKLLDLFPFCFFFFFLLQCYDDFSIISLK